MESTLSLIRCERTKEPAGAFRLPRRVAAHREGGRVSFSSLLISLLILLGCGLLAAPLFYGLLRWGSVAYVIGAIMCFVIAARWLVQMRDTPCLSSFLNTRS